MAPRPQAPSSQVAFCAVCPLWALTDPGLFPPARMTGLVAVFDSPPSHDQASHASSTSDRASRCSSPPRATPPHMALQYVYSRPSATRHEFAGAAYDNTLLHEPAVVPAAAVKDRYAYTTGTRSDTRTDTYTRSEPYSRPETRTESYTDV
uniref:Uncharacterized protein n=1 Tax=Mycena chlorophos TaxID=658473 RepID=A0ABQ0KVK5_MYCCL|nr:predicted protein [Mycena chlorophos]